MCRRQAGAVRARSERAAERGRARAGTRQGRAREWEAVRAARDECAVVLCIAGDAAVLSGLVGSASLNLSDLPAR